MFRALLPLLTLSLSAQTPAPDAQKPEAPKTAAPAPGPAPAQPVKPAVDKTIAVIDHRVYRNSDFEKFLDMAMNPQQRAQMAMYPPAREQMLKRYLEFQLLAAKGRKDHLQQSDLYKRMMAMSEMQALVQALMERDDKALRARMALKDEDIKAYYDKNPDKFTAPETFSARHILISVKDSPAADGKGLGDEEAKAKVAKVQEELKAGKKFEDLAKEYSDDPGSKEKGGLYENISFGSFVPEFEEAVRKQAVGQVGEPVKTKYGYHLIQVEKLNPSQVQPFDTAKEKAQQLVTQARQEQVMKDYIDGIKKEIPYTEGEASAVAPQEPALKKVKASKKTPQGVAK